MAMILDAALALAGRGFSVIPIQNGSKLPACKWREYQDAAATPEAIRVWFTHRFPRAGVGIVTGPVSGCFVIDVDAGPGKVGGETIHDLQMKFDDLPETLTVKTGGGGVHYFFKHPGFPIKTGKSILGEDVDIRGDGGFVVAPPTVHSSGLPYQFVDPDAPVADAPDWLLELLRSAPPPPSSPPSSPSSPSSVPALAHDSFGRIIDGREDYMTRLVHGAIMEELETRGAGTINPEELFSRCWDTYSAHAAARGESLEADGRGETLLRAKIAYAIRRVGDGALVSRVDPPPGPGERDIFDLDQFGLRDFQGPAPPMEWLVEGAIPLGIPFMLAAQGGAGKTFLALDLCFRVGIHNPFKRDHIMGGRVCAEGTCVFLTAEDSTASIHRRIEGLDWRGLRAQASVQDRIRIVPAVDHGGARSLMTQLNGDLVATDAFLRLRDSLSRIAGLRLLVIDPLNAWINAPINEDPQAGQKMWKAFATLASELGITVMVIHHTKKHRGKIETLSQARELIQGTSAVVNGCRLAHALWIPEEDDSSEIFQSLKVQGIADGEWAWDRVVIGGTCKANDPVRLVKDRYIRLSNGSLKCVTDESAKTYF
jgi:hypothetical protein